MPLGFINLGYEDAGTFRGFASGWAVAFLSNTMQFAAYGDTLETMAYETFEQEWDSNEDGLSEFDLVTDVDFALYDTIPTEYEDFEHQWAGGNQVHYIILPATVLAAYDTGTPEDVEDYEEEWNDNEDDLTEFAPGDLTIGTFDSVPENVEDYEEEWSSNEDDITAFAPGDTALAAYDTGGVSEDVEDFEEVDLVLYRAEVTDIGADGDEYHMIINGSDVLYEATGVGPESAIRDVIVTKINAQLAGIAIAAPDGGAVLSLRSAVSGTNLTVSVETTGAAKMVLSYPDRSAYWTQLGEL